jgi:proton glutamate symport protein
MLRSLSVRVLIALVVGLALGAAAAAWAGEGVKHAIDLIESVGGLWLNALRMTVVPLIFAILVTGVSGVADAAATGRLAVKTLVLILIFMTFSALFALVWLVSFYAIWPVHPDGAAALRLGATSAPELLKAAPKLTDFIKNLAPSNPIKAASEDSILPLVVFAGFFGFAVTRLAEARRRALTELFESIAEAMVTIVRWVLEAAPIGVFALALGVGLRAGVGAAPEIVHYMASISLGNIVIGVVMALVAVTLGRIPAGLWIRATAPVQVAAFATQSSLACLPAMVERSRDDLGIPDRVTGLALPLSVALLRVTGPFANYSVALFVAQIYGVHLSAGQYVAGTFVAVATSLAAVSLPGQVSFFFSIAPICVTLGLPVDLLPILIAVEVVPDIFRTIGNVTGDMTLTTLLWRGERAKAPDPAAATA